MCNPAILMGVQAYGALQQTKAAQDEGSAKNAYYQYLAAQNLKQANTVTTTANLNTDAVASSAAREEANLSRATAVTEGAQKAGLAANGVWGGSGTASDVIKDTENKAALDRAAIRQNANIRTQAIAKGATDQATALKGQASGYQTAGANAEDAGRINAQTSLLNGATQVASNWYKWKMTQPASSKDPLADVYGGI